MELKVYHQDCNAPYKQLAILLHEAYKTRKDEGLIFQCSNFTESELHDHVYNGYLIVAYEDEKPIGMVALIPKKRFGISFVTHEYLAVSAKKRNSGIATSLFLALFTKAEENGFDFIISSTAVGAKSSVRYHEKMGFITFLYVAFPKANYYSYCFIYPIKKFKFLRFSLFRIPLLYVSKTITRLTKRR